MRSVALGKTGEHVSVIMLGGHEYLADGRSRGFNEDMAQAVTPGFIGEGYGGPRRVAVLHAAYDLGINAFDVTIDSEKEALGRTLHASPPPYPVLVQTRPEGMCYSYDRNNARMLDLGLLRAEVQRSLALLRRDAVDLYNIGLLAWSIDSQPDYMQRLAHNLGALKQEGLIRHAVADSFSGERLYLAMIDCGAFDVVNIDLNLGDACGLHGVVPRTRSLGLGLFAREAFFKGELFSIAAAAGFPDRGAVARAAIKWVAGCGPDCILVGVDDADQLRANAAALERPALAEDESALLTAIAASAGLLDYQARKTAEFYECRPS